MPDQRWDVFVSYASDDRLEIVITLVNALKARGLSVWFDQERLELGDRLRRTIGDGLSRSRFAVVVVSQASLQKRWPLDEWSALLALEESGQKRFLPVTYGVSRQEVATAFPLIADRLSADLRDDFDRVVETIVAVVRRGASTKRRDVLIDFSHRQGEWDQLSRSMERPDSPSRLTSSWLEQPDLLENARVVLVPPPFHCRLTAAEIDCLEGWVNGGGGLLVFGCYDQRHHASNPSELAWRFDFEFHNDVVLPAGSTEMDARAHVFSRDPRYAVAARPSVTHRVVEGVSELALVSAASVWPTTMTPAELLIESPADAVAMRPLGHILPDGSRPAIEMWTKSGGGCVPLVGVRSWGQGRVIVAGTWKICTVEAADNQKFLRNAIVWLGGD